MLDKHGCVVCAAPTSGKTGDLFGTRVDELVQPCDAVYILGCVRQVFESGDIASCMVRDLRGDRAWLVHVELAHGSRRNATLAVVVYHPVCPLVFELSQRQRQILHELTIHLCTKKVATLLRISEGTIRSHLRRAEVATRSSDLTELLQWANNMQHALAMEDKIQAYLARRQR